MKTTTYTELCRNLATTIDTVVLDHEPVVITREQGKPAVVLVALEDFASFAETRHLLRSPRNAESLGESIAELERGGGSERSLIE